LIEAVYFKKPVIATDILGPRDLVEDGKSGYLVNSEEEFAERLIQLAKAKELRDRMGTEGFRRNASLFRMDNMAAMMDDIYA
jgi:glycosyltransferase involved in cell wall biosynthesis